MTENVRPDDTSEPVLTPKQQKLITSLLAGCTIIDAAQESGISEKTAHAWLKLPHVTTAYHEAQQQVFDEALRLLMLDTTDARLTLRTIMQDTSAPHGNRVRAAQILLEQSIELHKLSDLERKLAVLEQVVKDKTE